MEGIQKEKISASSELGDASPESRKSIYNFVSSFWAGFRQAEAKNMAEACRAEVGLFALIFSLIDFLASVVLLLFFACL